MGIFSFRAKREKEELEELFRRRIEEQLSKIIEEGQEKNRLLESVSQGVRQNSTDIRKHDMALEDCLDMLEEQREEETQSQKRIKELKEDQEKLLELLAVYQEQVWDMRKYAAGHDQAWASQLELAGHAVKGKEMISGIKVIDETGADVDYSLHEIIEIRDTDEAGRAQTIAEIFHPGYVYKGVVKKKAKAAAYRHHIRPDDGTMQD